MLRRCCPLCRRSNTFSQRASYSSIARHQLVGLDLIAILHRSISTRWSPSVVRISLPLPQFTPSRRSFTSGNSHSAVPSIHPLPETQHSRPHPRGQSSDVATLPSGYLFYPHHSDKPDTPPSMTHIFTSHHQPLDLPKSSVFQYLFPPENSSQPKRKSGQAANLGTLDENAIAFIDGLTGESRTRKQIREQALRLAGGLSGIGVKTGDVALLFGFNSLQYVNALLGCQALGVVVSPANAAYSPDELLHQLSNSTASAVFVHPSILATLLKALELAKKSAPPVVDIPQKKIILLCSNTDLPKDSPYRGIEQLWEERTGSGKSFESITLKPEDESKTAYLCYSSGTTGRAKGVETTHHNMTSQVEALKPCLEPLYPDRDIILGFLPFSHIYGLTMLLHQPLAAGVPVVILPRFDEIAALSVIQKYKITFTYVAPPVLILLLHSKNVGKYDISTLRGVMSGAAPLSSELADAVQEKLKFVVTQGYGLTETSPVAHVMTCEESLGRKGSVGKLLATFQARLVNDEGKDVNVGKRGELWLRGPSVMKGYWRNPEATKNTFAEGGWFKTGDVAVVDKNGYFAIVDRVKELIKYKGFQVPPAELEALLLTHPKLSDAAVIGFPAPALATELPRAYVVPKAGLDSLKSDAEKVAFSEEIASWVAKKVANHKKLRGGVILVETIPKSPTGKILRKDLRELAKQEIEAGAKSTRQARL